MHEMSAIATKDNKWRLWLLKPEVLKYLTWKERVAVICLDKSGAYDVMQRGATWSMLASIMADTHMLYVPKTLPTGETWRRLFFEMLWPLRNMWDGEAAIAADAAAVKQGSEVDDEDAAPFKLLPKTTEGRDGFKVSVFARFKPVPEKPVVAAEAGAAAVAAKEGEVKQEDEEEITLPLHQRLALIKLSRGLKTNRSALKVLMQEGSWFGKKWDGVRDDERKANEAAGRSDSPLKTPMQIAPREKLVACVQSLDPAMGRCVMVGKDVGLREFSFDGVLPPTIRQDQVYDGSCRKLVIDFLNGFNACVIGYGQTGSGKTYTMFGPDGQGLNFSTRGLVPRACEEVLEAISKRTDQGIEADMACSYVEIYGDSISDLLKGGARCGQNKVSAQRFVLSGAAETPVSSMEDISAVLKQGEAQKRRAATAMNERSSRAHAIFILRLRQKNLKTGAEASARLFMADLGGCEQVKKSGVQGSSKREKEREAANAARRKKLTRSIPNGRPSREEPEEEQEPDENAGENGAEVPEHELNPIGFVMGERLREAVYINLGLLSLKKCIEALNNKSLYVPYQDSKLTMLLSAGLGGDSKTSVVVCGSMEPKHSVETMAALRFGEKCALVETEARNKASLIASILAALDRDIKALEATIKTKERWEMKEELRVDELAEAGTYEAMGAGGVEVRKVSVLTGAETERKELEKMLRKRAELTGSTADIIDGGGDDDDDGGLAAAGSPSAEGEKENATGAAPTGKKKAGRGKKAMAFGGRMAEAYGLGIAYQADADRENERFDDAVADEEDLPLAVTGQWKVEKVDHVVLAKKAKKVKRNKLVYSGMSYFSADGM